MNLLYLQSIKSILQRLYNYIITVSDKEERLIFTMFLKPILEFSIIFKSLTAFKEGHCTMLLTLIEIPVVALYLLTREASPRLRRVIKKLNNLRRKSLDKYGQEEWVWENYDGEEDEYAFLERHWTIGNLAVITFLVVFYAVLCVLAHFGIYLD